MNFLPMFISFIVACVVINVCLTKRRMKIARAFFLGFGIVIGTCSLFLIYVDSQVAHLPLFCEAMQELSAIFTQLLSISTLVFGVATLVIVAATLILSVIAIKKIAEYFKNKKRTESSAPEENQKPIAEPTFACLRKIFVLHCRWNN